MPFLVALMVMIAVAIGIFVGYAIHISKKDNYESTLKILTVIVKVGMLVAILSQVVLTIISLIATTSDVIIVLAVLKQVITTTFLILIYNNVIKLMNNLAKKEIFITRNSYYVKGIGLLFLYLALTEIIVGLIVGVIMFRSYGNFTITFSSDSSVFVYIIVGLAMQIIAKILKMACKIYEENQLTI
ncbi:MAG: DUF2975 domain-containing protein [Bacilli bacterium]|nr:DUF2975 domain-containing protein [Bacilli bacterium]MBN2876358.1 DUF2975 domain-containing protein [Bacilli bacterium]